MATEEQVQDPATSGEVSVSVTEENEFPLDPSLLELSGNDVQQYCTMLSLLEFQNIKPHMFLKTEHGEMLLSLVTVVEEFEVGPWSYEGNESVPFDLPQQGSPGPQVRIQYNFVLDSDGGVLQENPSSCQTISRPERGTEVQTSKNKSVGSGGNLSMFSQIQKGCLLEQRLMGNSNPASQQQEGFGQPPDEMTAGPGNAGPASEQNNTQDVVGLDLLWKNDLRTGGHCSDHGDTQNNTQDAVGLDLLWRNDLRTGGHCSDHGDTQNNTQDAVGLDLLWRNDLRTGGHCGDCGVEEVSIGQIAHQEERSQSCNSSGESADERLSSVVLERSRTGGMACSCPNCGRVLSLNGDPVTELSPHTREKLYKCPSCGHLCSLCTPGSAEHHQVALTSDWGRLFCQRDLNHPPYPKKDALRKRFYCPECGRGFVHKSSIPRHQKLHRKETLSQNSGPEKSCSPAGNRPCRQKTPSRKKPLSCPDGGLRPAVKERGQFAALCEVCGKSFSLASKFQQHLATHSQEKPFGCGHCGKAFGVKSVLVRHLLLHQQEKPFRCHYCDKGYIQKSHLNRHYQKNHQMYE